MTTEKTNKKETPSGESWRLDNPRDWYFDGSNPLIKLMRFFNLLEIGKPVISWSKMMLAVSFFITVVAFYNYLIGGNPEGLEQVLAATGTFTLTLTNYVGRRWFNYLRFVRGEELKD